MKKKKFIVYGMSLRDPILKRKMLGEFFTVGEAVEFAEFLENESKDNEGFSDFAYSIAINVIKDEKVVDKK